MKGTKQKPKWYVKLFNKYLQLLGLIIEEVLRDVRYALPAKKVQNSFPFFCNMIFGVVLFLIIHFFF